MENDYRKLLVKVLASEDLKLQRVSLERTLAVELGNALIMREGGFVIENPAYRLQRVVRDGLLDEIDVSVYNDICDTAAAVSTSVFWGDEYLNLSTLTARALMLTAEVGGCDFERLSELIGMACRVDPFDFGHRPATVSGGRQALDFGDNGTSPLSFAEMEDDLLAHSAQENGVVFEDIGGFEDEPAMSPSSKLDGVLSNIPNQEIAELEVGI